MKKLALFSVLILFFVQLSFSQENFVPGYIVKQPGDTIQGLIDYRNWGKNPKNVCFKNNSQAATACFSPSEIIGFGVKEDAYVSGFVEIELSERNLNHISPERELKLRTDTVFLLTLVNGEKSLYLYRDSRGYEHFYFRQGSEFKLLIYKKFLKKYVPNYNDMNGIKHAAMENKRYVGQLLLYLNDEPSLVSLINRSSYTQESLVGVFKAYYKATQADPEIIVESQKDKVEFGVLGGMTISSIDFSQTGINSFDKVDYGGSVNFTGGFYCDLIISRNLEKWSLNNEVLYISFQSTGSYEDYRSENQYLRFFNSIDVSHLRVNNMVRYKHPVGTNYWFANAGVTNGFIMKQNNWTRTESKFYSNEEENETSFDINRHEFGFNFGVGLRIKRMTFESRYETSGSVTVGQNVYDTSFNRLFFLLGFRF